MNEHKTIQDHKKANQIFESYKNSKNGNTKRNERISSKQRNICSTKTKKSQWIIERLDAIELTLQNTTEFMKKLENNK